MISFLSFFLFKIYNSLIHFLTPIYVFILAKNIIKKRQLFAYVDADNHSDQDMLYPLMQNMTNEEPVTKFAKRKLIVRDKKRHPSTNYEGIYSDM